MASPIAPSRTAASRPCASSDRVSISRVAADSWSPRDTRACMADSTGWGVSVSASASRSARAIRTCSPARAAISRSCREIRRTSSSASPTTSSRSWTRRVGTRIESPPRGLAWPSSSGSGSSGPSRRGTATGSSPAAAASRAATTAASSSGPTGRDAPGSDRLMLSADTRRRSTRSLRTVRRPFFNAPSRSSTRCATSTTPSRPSMRAEPLTVWASRNMPLTSWRGDGWLSSRSRPSHSEARRSSTSARKVATSSGSSAQLTRPGTARSTTGARRRAR